MTEERLTCNVCSFEDDADMERHEQCSICGDWNCGRSDNGDYPPYPPENISPPWDLDEYVYICAVHVPMEGLSGDTKLVCAICASKIVKFLDFDEDIHHYLLNIR